MSVVSQSTVTTKRHDYTVPSPGCWTDVLMAIRMALRDYNEHHGKPSDSEPSDDAIQVESWDDEMKVFWQHKVDA